MSGMKTRGPRQDYFLRVFLISIKICKTYSNKYSKVSTKLCDLVHFSQSKQLEPYLAIFGSGSE